MTPAEVCRAAFVAGLGLRADGADLVVKHAERMTPALREMLTAHKPELLPFLIAAERTTVELIEAAMRACDQHGDGPEAREQMERECRDTPAHLRSDLCDHLRRSYPAP